MSTKLYSYREGDRSEYLALYLLSAIGLVAPVPRQEDIGFDFVCSVSDRKGNTLQFRDQYLVSVKSVGKPSIHLSPPEKWQNNDNRHHLSWFFELDLPLILAVVDKEVGSVALYSTTGAWYLFEQWSYDCGALHLVPRVNSDRVDNVARPKKGAPLESYPNLYEFTADLGHPLIVLTNESCRDKAKLEEMKEKLRLAIFVDSRNRYNHRMGVPFFAFSTHTAPDGSNYQYSFSHDALRNPSAVTFVMKNIAPVLASMAKFFRNVGNKTVMHRIGAVLRIDPRIDPLIKAELAEILIEPDPLGPSFEDGDGI